MMRSSLKSAPGWMDKKKAEATFSKRKRKTSLQANQDRAEQIAAKEYYDGRYKHAWKKATLELYENNNSGNRGKHGYGARAIAEKYNATLTEEGDRKIRKSALNQYATKDFAGKSPPKRGRRETVPSTLTSALGRHAVMMQTAGTEGEASSAKLKEVTTALVSGTEWEGKFSVDYAVRKAVEKNPTIIQPVAAKNNEDARVEWLTFGNINEWTNHLKKYLCDDVGFMKNEPGLISKCTCLLLIVIYLIIITHHNVYHRWRGI